MFEKQSGHFASPKEFLSELVKMVMVVPFSDKVLPAPDTTATEPEVEMIEDKAEEEKNNSEQTAAVGSFSLFGRGFQISDSNAYYKMIS